MAYYYTKNPKRPTIKHLKKSGDVYLAKKRTKSSIINAGNFIRGLDICDLLYFRNMFKCIL
jgi:hypothetical protein